MASAFLSCGPDYTKAMIRRSKFPEVPAAVTSQTIRDHIVTDKPITPNASSRQSGSSFRPGHDWQDTDGRTINAHGGGFFAESGTYYWFGEHKGRDGLARVGISLYSSQDLYNWQNLGIVLAVDETNPESDIATGAIIERPKVIFNAKTKKYVMWFHLELKGQGYGAARAGVATSDKVDGPYKFIESFRPNNEMSRDQTLFVDTDGKAFQITASEENQTMHINELSADYLRASGKFVRVFSGRSMEAPAVFMYDGRYHLIASGSTGWDPNAARQAVATNIMGPWQELDNPAQGQDAPVTFHSQSTYVLEVKPGSGQFVYIGDRWNPENLQDSRYIWLPMNWHHGQFNMIWRDEWDLSVF